MASVDAWARLAIFSLALAVVLVLIYLFVDALWLRKTGFFGSLLFLLVFIVCNIFAYQQRQSLTHRDSAIIISSAVPVKSTPVNDGTDLFILHEGTKVTVVDNSMQDWKEIRVADGKMGWVQLKQIEMI